MSTPTEGAVHCPASKYSQYRDFKIVIYLCLNSVINSARSTLLDSLLGLWPTLAAPPLLVLALNNSF